MSNIVRWDSDEEWEMERRAIMAHEGTAFVDICDLINDLWQNYCAAKEIEPDIITLKQALDKYEKGKSDHHKVIEAVRVLVQAYEDSYKN